MASGKTGLDHLDEMVLTRGLLSVKPKSETSFWRAGLKTITLIQGFPGSSEDEISACNVGDLGSIPGLGRSPGEDMATHSSILAWKIPWTEEPGRLQSMGLQRVGHD